MVQAREFGTYGSAEARGGTEPSDFVGVPVAPSFRHPSSFVSEPPSGVFRLEPGPARQCASDLCFWYHSSAIARASASCRYRIGNLTEVVRGATAVIDSVLSLRALQGKRALITARPFIDRSRLRSLATLRKKGVRLIGDFDDLLFDCPIDDFPPVMQGDGARSLHQERLGVYRDSLRYFDAFTVATEPLAEHLRALQPGVPVHVVPNGVSPAWARQTQLVYRSWQPGDRKIIRYLPGSPSHDADFAMVSHPLRAFLLDHPDVHFEVVGPLHWDTTGFPSDRIAHRPRVRFEHLGEWLASSWVNLAPLAATEFNRCKSAIKYLESAVVGCPTLATPIPDVARHRAGAVLTPRGADDWYSGLTLLLDDATRMELGSRARRYALGHATARQSAESLLVARAAWAL